MEHLFSNFSPVSAKEWEAQIEKDLKGASFDELFWECPEGIKIAPFYTQNDKEYTAGFAHTDWSICESVLVESPKKANAKALEILNKGVSHLLFRIDNPLSKKELEILLNEIQIAYISIDFKGYGIDHDFVKNYATYIKAQGIDKLDGTLFICPLKRLAQHGQWNRSEEVDFQLLEEAYALTSYGIRPVSIGGDLYHNAGANVVQQIAYILGELSEYLSRMKAAGVSDDSLSYCHFEIGIGTHYFMAIAKLRVLRNLIGEVLHAYGVPTKNFHIHGESDLHHLTIFDPHVNLLRTTTQAMAAALGGCDSIRVRPFDTAYAYPSGFSNRLARNIQLILKGESYFNKVADPASGSYYVEELCERLSEKSWALFQEIEKEGGYFSCLKSGKIQQEIENHAQKESSKVSSGETTLLGTNKYPNPEEAMNHLIEKFVFSDKESGQDVQPIRVFRLSEEIEKERLSKEIEQA